MEQFDGVILCNGKGFKKEKKKKTPQISTEIVGFPVSHALLARAY